RRAVKHDAFDFMSTKYQSCVPPARKYTRAFATWERGSKHALTLGNFSATRQLISWWSIARACARAVPVAVKGARRPRTATDEKRGLDMVCTPPGCKRHTIPATGGLCAKPRRTGELEGRAPRASALWRVRVSDYACAASARHGRTSRRCFPDVATRDDACLSRY